MFLVSQETLNESSILKFYFPDKSLKPNNKGRTLLDITIFTFFFLRKNYFYIDKKAWNELWPRKSSPNANDNGANTII